MSEDLVSTQSHCVESYSPGHHVCMLQYSTGLNLCKLQKFSCSDNWNAELSRSRLPKLINLRPASLWYYRLKCLAIERLLSNTRQSNDIYHLNREICHNFVIWCRNFRTALEGTQAAEGQPFCKAVVFLVSKEVLLFVSRVWSRALFRTVIVYRLNIPDRIVKVPSAFITYPIFSLFYSSLDILLKRSSRPVNIARTNDLVQDKIVGGLRFEYKYKIEYKKHLSILVCRLCIFTRHTNLILELLSY